MVCVLIGKMTISIPIKHRSIEIDPYRDQDRTNESIFATASLGETIRRGIEEVYR